MTHRQLLRPLNIDRDAAALHAVFGDEESCRYLPRPATRSVDETHALLTSYLNSPPGQDWVIVDTTDGDALGRVVLIEASDRVFEIGVMLAPAARGRGLATAALIEAIDDAFTSRAARRLFADIDPDNHASIALFERLGFQNEGRLRENFITHIGARDSLFYGLLAADPRPTP